MKRNYYLILCLILSLCSACKKDKTGIEANFNNSYQAWIDFKTTHHNSYRYQLVQASWTGNSSETTITVKNGQVVGRKYVAKMIERPSNTIVIYKQWEEDLQSLHSHNEGMKGQTLDEIYQKAKTDWIIKRADAWTTFESKNNGMISAAGYSEKNCTDDCFIGVNISFIEKL